MTTVVTQSHPVDGRKETRRPGEQSEPFLRVNEEDIYLSDLLRRVKWRQQSLVQASADAALLRQAAIRRGLDISLSELQQAADDFRRAHNLCEVAATRDWLARNHLSLSEWEIILEEGILTNKLRESVTSGNIELYFATHKLHFDAATISQIVVNDEDVAKELRAQVIEGAADFYSLARQYSTDSTTRPASGYVGTVKRQELEASVESAIFGAQEGAVVGPVSTSAGWRLIKIEKHHPARLTETVRENIKSLLFVEWLSELRRASQIEVVFGL